jgi:deazaflavin-dependent oxidoreductase (nitroreductase family)
MGFVQAVRSLVAPVTHTRVFRRVAPRVLPSLERGMARVTGGRLQLSGVLVPSLVLHSVGARSGIERDTILMYTPLDAHTGVIAGSSFGRTGHPAWSFNLLEHPDAAVSLRGRRHDVRAEPVPDAERDEMWRRIEAQWPGYRRYERESGRTVRLFRLVPRPRSADVPF